MRTFVLQLIACCILPLVIQAQHKKVIRSAEPLWITYQQFSPTIKSLDFEAEDGYTYLLFDKQVNLQTETIYKHLAKRIISESGVQNASEVSVEFDPLYEKLIFHEVSIFRNGKKINKLNLRAVKVLQQEKELHDFIYNGLLSAVVILDDVRVGDIIDYSYSIQGFNPIYNNKFSTDFATSFSVPIYQVHYKLVVPSNRLISFRYILENSKPVVKVENGLTCYEWIFKDLKSLREEEKTPSWYDNYSSIQVSEYQSWKEINEWAMDLFPKNPVLSASLKSFIKKVDAANTKIEEKVQAVLRFVQDDIRYMGYEMGENSHKPAPVSKVFAQRFGDCKEKSYLLCAILSKMNIPADPVLVNTSYKNNISGWLPSPSIFDHVVVRVKIRETYYFFDPTISFQRGPVHNLYMPDYKVGLVLTDTTSCLSGISFRNTSNQQIKNVFTSSSMEGEGKLQVTTVNSGYFADEARNDFNSISNYELLKNFKKFYASNYDNIEADSLTYHDDEITGTFTTKEYYTLPKFWEIEKGIKKFYLSPMVIRSIQSWPDAKRSVPLALKHPASYTESTVVHLPENWNLKPSTYRVSNSCFTFETRSFASTPKSLNFETKYSNLKDHVSPEEITAYLKDLEKFEEEANYSLTYGMGDSGQKKPGINGRIIFIVIITASIVFGVIRKYS